MMFQKPLKNQGHKPLQPLPRLYSGNFFSYRIPLFSIDKGAKDTEFFSSKYQLPSTQFLFNELPFADVYGGWNDEGLVFGCDIKKKKESSSFPDIAKGDSVELFIDTRDLKTVKYPTRFCHHFFFLAEPVEGKLKGEITRLRQEEQRPKADEEALGLDLITSKTSYRMKIHLPRDSLFGYDPEICPRLGFTYRINRYQSPPQHFTLHSKEFVLEDNPAMWSTLCLEK